MAGRAGRAGRAGSSTNRDYWNFGDYNPLALNAPPLLPSWADDNEPPPRPRQSRREDSSAWSLAPLALALAATVAVAEPPPRVQRKPAPVSDQAWQLAPLSAPPSSGHIVSVQTGEATLSDGGTETAVISLGTNVVLANTAVFWQVRADSYAMKDRSCRVYLSDVDELTIARIAGTTPLTVRWYVVHFDSTVSVQTGITDATGAGGDFTATISSVDLTKSFPLNSYRYDDANWSNVTSMRCRLPSATEIRWQSNGGIGAHDFYWQVISWDGATVQHAQLALNGSGDSDTQSITAVDLDRTFIVSSAYTSTGVDSGSDVPIAALDDTVTVSIARPSGGDAQFNDGWDDGGWGADVVELPVGYTVQYVTGTITDTNATADVAITAVDTAKAFVIPAGLWGLTSGHSASGDAGDSWATGHLLDTDTLRVTRVSSSGDATYAFYVVSEDSTGGSSTWVSGEAQQARPSQRRGRDDVSTWQLAPLIAGFTPGPWISSDGAALRQTQRQRAGDMWAQGPIVLAPSWALGDPIPTPRRAPRVEPQWTQSPIVLGPSWGSEHAVCVPRKAPRIEQQWAQGPIVLGAEWNDDPDERATRKIPRVDSGTWAQAPVSGAFVPGPWFEVSHPLATRKIPRVEQQWNLAPIILSAVQWTQPDNIPPARRPLRVPGGEQWPVTGPAAFVAGAWFEAQPVAHPPAHKRENPNAWVPLSAFAASTPPWALSPPQHPRARRGFNLDAPWSLVPNWPAIPWQQGAERATTRRPVPVSVDWLYPISLPLAEWPVSIPNRRAPVERVDNPWVPDVRAAALSAAPWATMSGPQRVALIGRWASEQQWTLVQFVAPVSIGGLFPTRQGLSAVSIPTAPGRSASAKGVSGVTQGAGRPSVRRRKPG